MSTINTTINITQGIGTEDNFDMSLLRNRLLTTLQENYFDVISKNKINCISGIGDSSKDINVVVSQDDNIINFISTSSGEVLSSIEYFPYISYVKYTEFVQPIDTTESRTSTRNKYKAVATILLTILIDNNICGFSILSPQDIQLVDEDNDIYSIKNNINYNDYYGGTVDETTGIVEELVLPDIIKLQSAVINDNNSYYEVLYNDINDPYTIRKLPCINGNVYYNDSTYTFRTLFDNLYTNFTDSADETVLNNVLLNNKILCESSVNDNAVTITNAIQGFSPNIFDCPALNVNPYWVQNSRLNIGSTITIDDSNYVIADKNTLIQLTNSEIYAINISVIYDGKPHFFELVYPVGATTYYKLSGNNEWIPMPQDISTIETYIDAQLYNFDYKVEITDSGVTKEYYGNATLNIIPAEQYGYTVTPYNGYYDSFPHSLYIYTDADVQFSLDNVNWTSVAPIFVEPGTYIVYYRLIKNNYVTVMDNVKINILSNSITDDFDIDLSKNFIVMRNQLRSNVYDNIYISATTNNQILLSVNNETNINVSNFNGKFPNPAIESDITTIGTLQLLPGYYYLIIESYLPWYYQGVEPTQSNTGLDAMLLNNCFQYTIEYTNDSNPDENSNWITIGSNRNSTNVFYASKMTNIDIGDDVVGKLWDYSDNSDPENAAKPSIKRLVIKLDLDSDSVGDGIKTIRIKCTNTGTEGSYIGYNENISNNNIGVKIINMQEYITNKSIKVDTVNTAGGVVYLRFKTLMLQSKDINFAFNGGSNCEISGYGTLYYDNITSGNRRDTVTNIYDGFAKIRFVNNQTNNSSDTVQSFYTKGQDFYLRADQLALLQFNTYKKLTNSVSIDSTSNSKVYGYIELNT